MSELNFGLKENEIAQLQQAAKCATCEGGSEGSAG